MSAKASVKNIARIVVSAPETSVIPIDAIPFCVNGVRSDDYSASLVVTRDPVTGVCTWTWYARPFQERATVFQHPRHHWESAIERKPKSGEPGKVYRPALASVELAAYLPPCPAAKFAGGLFVSDDPDMPAACRRDAARYFPQARRAPAEEIALVHHSLSRTAVFTEVDLDEQDDLFY